MCGHVCDRMEWGSGDTAAHVLDIGAAGRCGGAIIRGDWGAAGVGDCGNYRAGGCADAHRAAVALARLLSHAAGGLQTIALVGVVVAAGVAVGAGEVAVVLPAAGTVATGAALAALPAAAAVAP